MGVFVKETIVKNILVKSKIPLGGYCANPYVGCSFACKYCYACFMKRFSKHDEEWGEFIDVKYWDEIVDYHKYDGERIIIGTVTDGYNHFEQKYFRTRALLEQLKNSDAKITICTKSDLILRDLDLLKSLKDVTISWSINTLDENFKNDIEKSPSIKKRLLAMKKIYDAGIKTVCFISPIFPGITDVEEIINVVRDSCDYIWLENLNLRSGYKKTILDYINNKYPHLVELYYGIYQKNNNDYWKNLDFKISEFAKKNGLSYLDNYLPDTRSKYNYPAIINYFFHSEIVGSSNSGKRVKK